ncbi:MAG: hypothetical protein RRC34_10635 [Lentisphaeria bacterium]|nr:hypothetical protein [Lentisphaeria bacterium]
MALTTLQVNILRLLAERRKRTGESYVAGGIALNQALHAPRRSQDIDFFHDTDQALRESWHADQLALNEEGYTTEVLHDTPSFIEASVAGTEGEVLIQWARDSAFRFFPLIEDELLGLALHPFDLATNKVLALVGRMEPRDWVDMVGCHGAIQPLGYLAWSACGKDPGFSPEFIIESASRQHYPQAEINLLAFDGPPPSAARLGAAWKIAVAEARSVVRLLPPETVGHCVMDTHGNLYSGDAEELAADLSQSRLKFHPGTIGGVWPMLKSSS